MAQKVAQAAIAFQKQRTGHGPGAVTVVIGGETLVVTLHDALSPAEKMLARDPDGATRVREFHKELFASAREPLLEEIKRITGLAVREAAAEVETTTGSLVQVFTTGSMVQVFQLVGSLPADSWTGVGSG